MSPQKKERVGEVGQRPQPTPENSEAKLRELRTTTLLGENSHKLWLAVQVFDNHPLNGRKK